MSNKTNLNPEGNLVVKGGITGESYLDIVSNADIGGNTSIAGSTDVRGDLVVGGTLVVESTDLTTFAGDVTIDGNLIAKGAITFSNTTINVVETVNNFDGYILNADSDASLAYFQINSDVSNIQLEYSENTLTVGYQGTTDEINFNAQTVNISDDVTIGSTANIAGATDIGGTLDVIGNTSLTNTAVVGAVDITGDVDVIGTGTFSGELTVNNNASIVGDLTLSNSTTVYFVGGNTLTEANYFGTASTADIWNTPRNLTLNLIGDVAGSATFVGIDGSQNLSVDLTTTVTSDNVALSDDTTGDYVSTMSDTANILVTNSNTSAEGSDISLDLSDSGVTAESYGVADQVAQFSVDEKGRITQAANVSIDIISGQVNDFVTAVRSNISNATGIDYDSATGVVSVSNTTISAGTYNSNVSEVTEFVVNEQGQLTSATTNSIAITSEQITDFNANISTYITSGVYVTEANGVLDVTADVVAVDRDATLAGDYTFTGNVNLSSSTFQTPANVALLDTDQTFNADNIFTANVDLSSATVIDPRLVRTDTPATLTNDYAFVGNLDLTGTVVTATTQSNVDNSTKVATTEYVTTAIGDLIGGAPQALDTLREISDSLNNNATLSNTLVASIAAAESNVVTVGDDRISSTGNISMSGNLDLGTNHINNLQSPVFNSDAANKSYVDTANLNMQTYVDDANAQLKTYTDEEKVDKSFTIGATPSFLLGTKLANGSLVLATDSVLSNPAAANDAVTFDNLDDVNNLFINTEKYDGPYAVLHQGVQNIGQANPVAADQERHGNLIITGSMVLKPGTTLDPNAPPERQGDATISAFGSIYHVANPDVSGQAYLSNVSTIFYKDDIGPVTGPNSVSSLTIVGSNIYLVKGQTDTLDLYKGSDTQGTMNAQATYSNVAIGTSRAHLVSFGASTMWLGDEQNLPNYTTVLERSTGSTYTTGNRTLERLTIDGAITVGERHTPSDLIVNGTIFFDRTNNVLKAIEADGITDLVQKSSNATIDLGDGTGDHSGATVVGSTYYLNQVSAGTGMEVTKDSANILTYSVDSDHVKNTALSNISVTSGALAYNSTTGVITAPTSTTDISEGTGLYYTDSRARNAISASGDINYDPATGVISFTNDQGDIESVTAGAGLTGGGTSGAVTLGVNTGTGLEVVSDQVRIALTGVTSASYGTNAATIPRFTVNGQGQLTSANTQPIAIVANQVTDFSEAVDDRVSSLLVGGDNVTVTYNDTSNTLTIDADLVGDITGVVAGTGLTGGGTSGDVTLNVDETFLANIATNVTTTGDISAANVYASGFFEGDLNGAVTIDVYNNTANTIAKGTAVYLTGTNTGDNPHIAPCDNTDPNKMPAIGIVMNNISASAVGQVVTSGVMNYSSHGYTLGADLYIQLGGALTTTVPSGESELLQKVGKVVNTNQIIVQGAFRTNAVPNLNNGNIFIGDTNNKAVTADLSNFNYEIVSNSNIETTANMVAQTLVVNGTANVTDLAGFASDVIVEGNLTVNGTTTTINATSLAVEDNMIYLNANSNVTDPDLGFTGNYNDGTYAHAGFFRDATDGYFKVFDSYTPEPDAAIDIDTSHATFNLADIRADVFRGNLVVPGAYSLPTTDGTASQVLTTDGNGSVTFTNVSAIGLTSVTGGDGLTATQGIGSVDLDVGAGAGIIVGTDTVSLNVAYTRNQFSTSGDLSYDQSNGVISFTERTDAEVRGLISVTGDLSYDSSTGVISYSRGPGDITAVTAGSGLTGGGSSGSVTLNIGAGNGINVSADSISVDMNDFDTDALGEGSSNQYFTTARARGAISAGGDLSYNSTSGEVSFTERTDVEVRGLVSAAGDLSYNSATGIFSVTTFKTSGARAAISVSNSSGYGSLSYNNTTGVISYTGPSASDVRGAMSGGDGITISSGSVSIDTADTDVFDSSNTGNKVVLRNASGNFSANVITANSFDGVASSAKYADLAEKYEADAEYEPGTVVIFGGEKEITITDLPNSARVAGVISTDPAYMMNAEANGLYVALRGRVPCKVIGKVKKGDVLVTSSTPGYAEVSGEPHFVGAACIVGKSLQSKDTDGPGVLEIVV